MTAEPTLDRLRLRLGRNLFEAERSDPEAGVSRLTPRPSFAVDPELGNQARGEDEEAVPTTESPVDSGPIH